MELDLNSDTGIKEDDKLTGIGGWLIFAAIGIVINSLQSVISLPGYLSIFSDGSWGALTTEGSEHYHAFWAPVIISELTFNLVSIGLWIGLAILLFTKSRHLPKAFVGVLAVSLTFVLINSLVVLVYIPIASDHGFSILAGLVRTILASCIWIPYMLISERVKNTFIN